jgi:hypothetical protein
MNVETTSRRIDWFLHLLSTVGLGDEGAGWLNHAVPAKSNRFIATLPADGWLLLSMLMQQEIYGPRGGVAKHLPTYKMSAMQEVQAAVNTRKRHPALDGRGVIGVAREIIPAWRDDARELHPFRRHFPYAADFRVMVPEYISKMGITRWLMVWDSADMPAGVDARLFEEREHLLFSVQVDAHR